MNTIDVTSQFQGQGRTGKQEKEQISPNHVQAFFPTSVLSYLYYPLHLQVPVFVLAPMTAIYVTSFITGVVGNVATGVVIVRNRSMHTATNYYLFSLALSDLVILLLGE